MSDDSPTRDTYHHGDLARAAVEAALERIGESGPSSLSLRALARQIGVSHRALYRHFADKRGLLVAIAIDGLDRLTTDIEHELTELPPDADTSEGLRAVVRAYIAFGARSPAHYLVAFGPKLNEDGRHPELEAAIERSLRVVQRVFESGVERGELRQHDSFVATVTLWSAVHGFTHLAVMRRWDVRPDRIGKWGRRALEPTISGLVDSLRSPA